MFVVIVCLSSRVALCLCLDLWHGPWIFAFQSLRLYSQAVSRVSGKVFYSYECGVGFRGTVRNHLRCSNAKDNELFFDTCAQAFGACITRH
jgi:hypothetical protein